MLGLIVVFIVIVVVIAVVVVIVVVIVIVVVVVVVVVVVIVIVILIGVVVVILIVIGVAIVIPCSRHPGKSRDPIPVEIPPPQNRIPAFAGMTTEAVIGMTVAFPSPGSAACRGDRPVAPTSPCVCLGL
ncbi:hypothetical protein [Desulfatirhabdium butyrativorans]|uniref:hypothetical protein n=1 Tax=Desulfatirhabdium butyrativorans TaxID=340467 RepID=UPI00041547BC|nr:hypothetical protein [Desulfatirhabdium butyrativorans]